MLCSSVLLMAYNPKQYFTATIIFTSYRSINECMTFDLVTFDLVGGWGSVIVPELFNIAVWNRALKLVEWVGLFTSKQLWLETRP